MELKQTDGQAIVPVLSNDSADIAVEADGQPQVRILSRRDAMRCLAGAGIAGVTISFLAGCGGGGASSSLTTSSATGTGRATLTITWPSASAESKLIPVDAKSITVAFSLSGTVLSTQTVARPTTGNTSTVSFTTLPAGTLSLAATAYPNSDGSGTAQATATSSVTINSGAVTNVAITMNSTIASLAVTPTAPTVATGNTTTLAAAAYDSGGNVVLISSSTLSWASSSTVVATVSSAGVVTGVAAGTAKITVTESESGKSGSVTVTVTASSSSSSVTAEGEIGPYFTDDSASGYNRSNILSNLDGTDTQTGIPLTLNITIVDSESSYAPYVGAQVDIWHCSASGVYSNESSEGTSGQSWLRGYQITDTNGIVTFTTIIPGWYQGRTTHIHLRVRSKYSEASSTSDETNTTQVFFAQSMIDTIDTTIAPYKSEGKNTTTNASDRVYSTQTKGQNLVTVAGDSTNGYTASYTIELPITTEY